jgi:hypothetical protein
MIRDEPTTPVPSAPSYRAGCWAKDEAEFFEVEESSVPPAQLGDPFPYEDGAYIRQEVERMVYEPKLPSAGNRERRWLRQLWDHLRQQLKRETVPMVINQAVRDYARALEQMLPKREWIRRKDGSILTLPGAYYSRKRVTPKNKDLFCACHQMRQDFPKDARKQWLADFLLEGIPEMVADFKMECLYLLRGADGNVTRLIKFVNMRGEESKGREVGHADVLTEDMFAGADKFRQYCLSKGNFNFGVGSSAGNLDLQKLHSDVSNDAAYRVIKLVQYVGWHALPKHASDAGAADGQVTIPGIWFYDSNAYVNGKEIRPDEDGIFWHDGEGYALSRRGREQEFAHGRPTMKPGITIESMKLNTEGWDVEAKKLFETNPSGGFYREVCRLMVEAAGGQEGRMAIGGVLGFAAAPEIFAHWQCFPGVQISGQYGSGKTTYSSWLMSFQGQRVTDGEEHRIGAGLGMVSSNVTAVGMMCQLENYSNLMVWADEFRAAELKRLQGGEAKLAIMRDAYGRQLATKWSPDGLQRVIRTMLLVSGESTSDDAATRSRYVHMLVSENKRLDNHHDWLMAHDKYLFIFWREIMERREEFVKLVMSQIESWINHKDLAKLPARERLTHAVAYASWAASHTAQEVEEYRKFMVAYAAAASTDVSADVNVNVFWRAVFTAWKAGEIDWKVFKVEGEWVEHPPGAPNQGRWFSARLLTDPYSLIDQVAIYLRKSGTAVTLSAQDLRDQLSKTDCWLVGKDGGRLEKITINGVRVRPWGFVVDKHPEGLQGITDDRFQASLTDQPTVEIGPVFKDGDDPRKGELFAIVDEVLRKQQEIH